MELILIRHGLPLRVENAPGAPADPALSDVGHVQAERMAQWLRNERIDRLYSSPLRRARETAKPLGAALGLAIELEPDAAEFDQHSASYIPMEHLKEADFERWQRLMRGEMEADLGAYILLKKNDMSTERLEDEFDSRHGIPFNEDLLNIVKDRL